MLEIRYVTEDALRGDRGPRLLRYLLDNGANEFSITVMALQDTPAPFADAFEDELGLFEHEPALRRVVIPAGSTEVTRLIRLWEFNQTTCERVLSFVDDGLFHWPAGPDGWLEDLMIFRDGELVLGLLSSEREGVLRLTQEEHVAVAALGITSRPNWS